MASTLEFSLVRDPEKLDLIDDEWPTDKLPDDGERDLRARVCSPLIAAAARRRRRSPLPPPPPPAAADIPLPADTVVLGDLDEEQKAKEPEKWMELGLQATG